MFFKDAVAGVAIRGRPQGIRTPTRREPAPADGDDEVPISNHSKSKQPGTCRSALVPSPALALSALSVDEAGWERRTRLNKDLKALSGTSGKQSN